MRLRRAVALALYCGAVLSWATYRVALALYFAAARWAQASAAKGGGAPVVAMHEVECVLCPAMVEVPAEVRAAVCEDCAWEGG